MVRYNRIFALMLAFVMAFTLAVAPALSVSAESVPSGSSNSLEVNIDAGGTAFNGKFYLDLVNEVLAAVGSMGYNGQTVMDAALYLDVSSAGPAWIVSGTPFLDQVYGIDLRNLGKNLPNSVFAPDSGSQLAMDQETYDMFMEQLASQFSQVVENAPARAELGERVMGALMPHLENYMTALMQNAQIAAGPKTLSLPTGEITTTTSTVTATGAVMAEAVTALINSLAEDPEALAVLAQWYDEMVNSGMLTPDEDMKNMTGTEVLDALFQKKDELCQELTKSLTESDMTISGVAALDQQTQELVSIGFELTSEGETVGLEAVFAGGTYSLEIRNGGESKKYAFSIQENTEKLLAATFSVIGNGVESTRTAFNWDKEAGTYEVTVSDDFSTNTLTGTITSTDTTATITFDQVDGQSLGNTYIKLSTDDPITVPSYKEVLTMTEEEVLQVVQNVSGIMQQLSE